MTLTFQPESETMLLWFVVYTDDSNTTNQDMFVTAPTPMEAFVRWRREMLLNDDDTVSDAVADGVLDPEHTASVYSVPRLGTRAGVHAWGYPPPGGTFLMDMDTLATKAIEAQITRERTNAMSAMILIQE